MAIISMQKGTFMPKKLQFTESTPVTVSRKASTCLNNYNTKIWVCDYAYILYEMSLLKECTLLK